jgi:hypothetical protein
MSCRRATTPTTSRRPILTAVRSAHLSARVVPAGCLRGRTPARRQWHIACSVGPPGLQACGDISSALAPQLGGRGRRELHVDVGQTASGPPLGGPRRIYDHFPPNHSDTPARTSDAPPPFPPLAPRNLGDGVRAAHHPTSRVVGISRKRASSLQLPENGRTPAHLGDTPRSCRAGPGQPDGAE